MRASLAAAEALADKELPWKQQPERSRVSVTTRTHTRVMRDAARLDGVTLNLNQASPTVRVYTVHIQASWLILKIGSIISKSVTACQWLRGKLNINTDFQYCPATADSGRGEGERP